MNDKDPKKEMKKGVPNSFVLFLLGALSVILLVQYFVKQPEADVSFSGQLEHLVNLDLLEMRESYKISINDNLVTFNGMFRDERSDAGKKHFKYLSLLNKQHNLSRQKKDVELQLERLKQRGKEAAEWFLTLSDRAIPEGGYHVVYPEHDSPGRYNHIVITQRPNEDIVSIVKIRKHLERIRHSASPEYFDVLEEHIDGFVKNMRSPILGVGNEPLKQKLREISPRLEKAHGMETSERFNVYEKIVSDVEGIIRELDTVEGGFRLAKLRGIRNYRENIEKHKEIIGEIDANEILLNKANKNVTDVVWFFKDLELTTRTLAIQDVEQYNQWFLAAKAEWENFDINKSALFKVPDQSRNIVLEKKFKSKEPSPNILSYLITMLPIILIVMLLYFVFARQMKGMGGGGAMNFGKSPARLLNKDQNKITFKDVAGIDEATEELEEIVEFLKSPGKFTALGGRIPKGVLCIGPPGTGKTLIAKAVAGEADRPFFSISGSDFVEMFVGVGASRVRDMFEQARKNAPCIIFMDEIDAVGRHRGGGIGGGHDEREQTLNQLLVEMDGFDSREGIILVAATNRPDVLDKALLRPGRFDRRIVLHLPDIKGRFEILKLHSLKLKIDESVDLDVIARSTPGASGADLENLLNEAALLAARRNRKAITMAEVQAARDKVLFGKERRSLEIDDHEKKMTAYHESGHAVISMIVEHAEPLEKVTIIPRGMALGGTHFLPKKNRLNYWKKEIIDQIAVLLGGRIAEEIFVGDISSGAQNDIERATIFARSMICEWGMSDALGAIAYGSHDEGGKYHGMAVSQAKNYSESTAKTIDDEVRSIIDSAYLRATAIIKENGEKVELMTGMLMEFETLYAEDVKEIMDNIWDIEKKRSRLKEADELHKKNLPPPPPPLKNGDGISEDEVEISSDARKEGASS
jgi:cell division protease FtsH